MDEPQYSSETSEIMNQLDSGEIQETPATEVLMARRSAAACYPLDVDGDCTSKRVIGRMQMDHINTFAGCFCAKCHKQMRITMAYKCRWCGVWYCHQCAAVHFGPDHTHSQDNK